MADQLGERTELVEDLVDRLSWAADGDADEIEFILRNSGDGCTIRLVVRCCEQVAREDRELVDLAGQRSLAKGIARSRARPRPLYRTSVASLTGRYPRHLLRQVVLFWNARRTTCCRAIVHERRVEVPGHLEQMRTHRVDAVVTVEPLVDLVE
jgi:hypothetical protein